MLFIVGSAFVLLRAVYLVADRLPDFVDAATARWPSTIERRKRAAAAGRLLRWGGTAVVVTVAALMTLRQLGVDLTPILAGGAVVSVALGFGAQNLVRDIIAGLFLIVENQVRVGDVANINGKGGLVEAIRLRVIVLRSLDGTVHIIPNGAITELSNLTKDFSYYVIDVGVAYRENVDHVMDVLPRSAGNSGGAGLRVEDPGAARGARRRRLRRLGRGHQDAHQGRAARAVERRPRAAAPHQEPVRRARHRASPSRT